jgi:hypothetical protein
MDSYTTEEMRLYDAAERKHILECIQSITNLCQELGLSFTYHRSGKPVTEDCASAVRVFIPHSDIVVSCLCKDWFSRGQLCETALMSRNRTFTTSDGFQDIGRIYIAEWGYEDVRLFFTVRELRQHLFALMSLCCKDAHLYQH